MRTAYGCAALAIVLCLGAAKAAAETVDLAIVLAADVSRSVDDDEFQLQRQGYAAAVTDPRVLHAVAAGQHGAIAVCFIEWSGPEEQQVVAEWTVIRDGETAASFAASLLSVPRSFIGRTSISAALDFGRSYFLKAGFATERRVIDVSGDGTNNSGRPVTDARDDAVAAGITVNGLAIINEHPNPGYFAHTQPPEGLPEYYRQNVIGGPGAFLLVVHDFRSFGEAMTNKLVNEIASAASSPTHARRAANDASLVFRAAITVPVEAPILEVYYASSCEPCRLELPVLAEAARSDGAHLVVVILDEEARARRDLAAAAPALDAAAIAPSPARDQRAILREAGDPDGILPYARVRQADGRACGSWRGILTLARIKSLLASCIGRPR